jgi:hypothetical protein
MAKKNKECAAVLVPDIPQLPRHIQIESKDGVLTRVSTPRSRWSMPWDIPPTQALRDLMALHRNATAAASGSTYTPVDPFANPNRVGLLTLARSILGTAR